VDALHAYLHRVNGCIFLGLAIIPWIGQRFRYAEDKHTVLAARVSVSLSFFFLFACLFVSLFDFKIYFITIQYISEQPATYLISLVLSGFGFSADAAD
jgi:hypothetical protein